MSNMVNNKNFIPLSVPHFMGNEQKYINECIDTGWVSSAGKYVNQFEDQIARYCNSLYSLACINGTAGLHLALLASNVSADDEVLIPTLTFIAPVNTIRYVGAHPVFIDCDSYLNISPSALKEFCETKCNWDGEILINKKTQRKVKTVILVHIFGHPVDMDQITPIARQYKLQIIEDATESLGSKYISGNFKNKMTGIIGQSGILSFNGNKLITTGGGGMLLTSNPNIYQKAKYLSTQAKDDETYYEHNEMGYNYRLSNVSAAIGCAQLENIEHYIHIKRKNFSIYKELLGDIENLKLIDEPNYSRSNFWFYSLVLDPLPKNKIIKDCINFLQTKQIQTRPVWKLNHLQKPYIDYADDDYKNAKYFYKHVLNLPCSVNLKPKDIEHVCRSLRELYGT